MAGQAGRLQGQGRSAINYPSRGHARRCLIWLSCDNRRTRHTALLAIGIGVNRRRIFSRTLHYCCDFCQKIVVKDAKRLPVPCMVPANQAPVPLSVLEPSFKFLYSDQACL
ncbi:hypothetical protein J6590_079160 [Homalodisca vitripennis]|nr:hypothetical protein J6590_032604 [Homalodisca vitripennis]KAG8334981.1 hypothetical protein J6590_079160 [Homalodisca vitripennis]